MGCMCSLEAEAEEKDWERMSKINNGNYKGIDCVVG